MKKINSFTYKNKEMPIRFIETYEVAGGISCDVYEFTDDNSMDLGLISVKKGHKTPLQKVLKGKSTLEGYLEGKGKLTVTANDGTERVYKFPNAATQEVGVGIGELMQWEAEEDLVFYEICTPPYEDGRFENIGA